mgnify:CR=1 FL=1
MKKTKVICTMGPNTNDRELIKQLALSGMDIARFNFSHGDHEEQAGRFALVKSVREEINKPIATLLDTKGPEIRTGVLKDDKKVTLKEGQKFTLTTRDIVGDDTIDMITYAGLPADVANGNTILIDDGLVKLEVKEISGTDIVCEVKNDGKISNRKGVNVPDIHINMEYMSKQDKSDIIFGIQQDVDYIAASFVRCAEDVEQIRAILKENGGENINIIAKIENSEGILNIDSIIEAADGIMVARGATGNPFLFEQIKQYLQDGTYKEVERERKANVILQQAGLCCEAKGERRAMQEFRKHAAWYLKGVRGAAALRQQAISITSMEELKMLIDYVFGEPAHTVRDMV